MQYPLPIAKLIDNFMKLPGIGEKTATRLAFYTLDMQDKDVEDFSQALIEAKNRSILVLFAVILPILIRVKFVVMIIVIKRS